MMNREERIDALKAAGIDTGKFMAMDVPEGATIIIATPDGKQCKYDRNGNRIDEILKKVKDIGYIKEDPDFRRWVMAQTFDILNSSLSMHEYIKRYRGYYYQFDQTLRELNAIAKMPDGDRKKIRVKFFNRKVVVALCEDYLDHLHNYIDNLPVKSHCGIPYKKVKGFYKGIHCKDIEGKVFAPLEEPLFKIKSMGFFPCERYDYIAKLFETFMDNMIDINLDDAKLCESWLSAYKGAGAYYTLMGLIKFHDCRVYKHNGNRYCWSGSSGHERLDLDDSIEAVNNKVAQILGNRNYYFGYADWYLLYGMLKEVIRDNNFNFRKRMKEIYGK